MDNERREFLDQMTIDDIKLVEATEKAAERIHAGIVDHHVATEGQITPSETTRRQAIADGAKSEPLSDLDKYILNDMKFIAQHTGCDSVGVADSGPVVIPAENAKPRLEKRPKKRSSRLSSEQRRRNRARRARDERRARRAISVDARLPGDDAVAALEAVEESCTKSISLEEAGQLAQEALLKAESISLDAAEEEARRTLDAAPEVVVPEKSFLEKRLDSALQRDAARHEGNNR